MSQTNIHDGVAEQEKKNAKIKMDLRVENNSKFVRGKTKVIEITKQYLKFNYNLIRTTRDEYIFYVPYTTINGLVEEVYNIIQKIADEADMNHCFIEADVTCDELGLYW